MLRIVFWNTHRAIFDTSVYFSNSYEEEWFDYEIVKAMVWDIDRAVVLNRRHIQNSLHEQIAPSLLSASAKTLILIYCEPENVFNVSQCGDNCAKWILEIARLRQEENIDITINLRHIMNFGEEPFDIFIENTQQTVHTMKELIPIARELLR